MPLASVSFYTAWKHTKKPEVFWCYFFNFFFYQIIFTYYKRLQQTNWKWKYNIKYKHTTTYYWTLCPLKSNKAIKNMITITKKPLDESQYVAKWVQWMHRKTYSCIYNEGFCNGHFLLSEKNDECWQISETWSISLANHSCCWWKVSSEPTSLNRDSKLSDKSKTAHLKMLSPCYKSEPLNLLDFKI